MRTILGILLILWGLGALTGISLGKYFLAVVLIIIGVRIIIGRRSWDNWDKFSSPRVSSTNSDTLNEAAIFSPLRLEVKSENFRGGKVVAIFGGGEIDLSTVKTKQDQLDLEVVAIFGGLKITLPKDINVHSEGTAIVGGFENRTVSNKNSKVLRLKGAAIFGGVELVN